MDRPTKTRYGADIVWSHPTSYIVEYAMWHSGRLWRLMDLRAHLSADLGLVLSYPRLANIIAKLTATHKVKKIGHGVYVHAEKEPVAEPLDIFA